MKSDNELIAEFMGLLVFPNMEEMQAYPLDKLIEWVYPDQIKYNTSWEWLMEVVEKIESLGFKVAIEFTGCTIFKDYGAPVASTGNWDTKINAVYNAVLGFIKWHRTL